jgi:uncharacterized membrane protein HdeD (DUF308 family)
LRKAQRKYRTFPSIARVAASTSYVVLAKRIASALPGQTPEFRDILMSILTTPRTAESANRWKWWLALGVVLLVLSVAAAGAATVLELASLLVFGPLLLTSSGMQLLTAFLAEKRNERLLHAGAAVLEAFLGFYVMAHPFENVVSLVAVVAVLFLVIGLARLAAWSGGRAWAVVTGMVALLLGISLLVGWPTRAFWFVGLCVAVDLLVDGVSWSALGLVERRQDGESLSRSDDRSAGGDDPYR